MRKRRFEKSQNRDVLDEIGREWARGRPKRLEGGSQRARGIDKNARRDTVRGQGLILSGVRIPCQTLATLFFDVRQFASCPCCTSECARGNPFGTRAAKFRTSIDSWPWARFLISLCCTITPASGLTIAYIHRQAYITHMPRSAFLMAH
jgi:hypothetical protein